MVFAPLTNDSEKGLGNVTLHVEKNSLIIFEMIGRAVIHVTFRILTLYSVKYCSMKWQTLQKTFCAFHCFRSN